MSIKRFEGRNQLSKAWGGEKRLEEAFRSAREGEGRSTEAMCEEERETSEFTKVFRGSLGLLSYLYVNVTKTFS